MSIYRFMHKIGEDAEVVVEFDYHPSEPPGPDYPGMDEEVEVLGVIAGGGCLLYEMSSDSIKRIESACIAHIRKLEETGCA